MNKEDLRKYNDTQRKEIEKYKWIKSEKEGKDVGSNNAALEWISKYAEHFSNVWVCETQCDKYQTELCRLNNILNGIQKPPEEIFPIDNKIRKDCDSLHQLKREK